MSKYCQQCGAPLEEGIFCSNCGAPVGMPQPNMNNEKGKKSTSGSYLKSRLKLAAIILVIVGIVAAASAVWDTIRDNGKERAYSTDASETLNTEEDTPAPETVPDQSAEQAEQVEQNGTESPTEVSSESIYAAVAVEEAKAWSYTTLGPETQYTYVSGPDAEDNTAVVAIEREGSVAAFSGSIEIMFMDGQPFDIYNRTETTIKKGYYYSDIYDGYVLYYIENDEEGSIVVTDLWVNLDPDTVEEEGLLGANGYYMLEAE